MKDNLKKIQQMVMDDRFIEMVITTPVNLKMALKKGRAHTHIALEQYTMDNIGTM